MEDPIESVSEDGTTGKALQALDITSVLRAQQQGQQLQQYADSLGQKNYFSSFAYNTSAAATSAPTPSSLLGGAHMEPAQPRMQPAGPAPPSAQPHLPHVLPGLQTSLASAAAAAASAAPSALPSPAAGRGGMSPGLPPRPPSNMPGMAAWQQPLQPDLHPAAASNGWGGGEEALEDEDADELPISQVALPPPSSNGRLMRRDQQMVAGGLQQQLQQQQQRAGMMPGSSRLPGVAGSVPLTAAARQQLAASQLAANIIAHQQQQQQMQAAADMRAQQALAAMAAAQQGSNSWYGAGSMVGGGLYARGNTASPTPMWGSAGRQLGGLPAGLGAGLPRMHGAAGLMGMMGGWVAPNQARESLDVLLERCEQISTDLRAALDKEKLLRPDASVAADAAASGSAVEPGNGTDEAAVAAGGPAAAAPRGGALMSVGDLVPLCGPLAACLKPYQVVGINFLLLLARERVGGAILADAMGLGKTAQAVCFLGALRELDPDGRRPHLVVAPASLLENWERELTAWCPGLRVVTYHGAARPALRRGLTAWRHAVADALASGELAAPPPGFINPRSSRSAAGGGSEDEADPSDSEQEGGEAEPAPVEASVEGGDGNAGGLNPTQLLLAGGLEAGQLESEEEGVGGSGLEALEGLPDPASGRAAFDVLVTTYTLFEREGAINVQDRVFLKGWRWGQVVLDEAHALKNAGSGRVTRLRALARKAVGRLMLTGTPLQNDLGELLNLLGFLLPKVFEGEALDELVASLEADPAAKNRLVPRMAALLAPFVLRRTKAELEGQLVEKKHVAHSVDMTARQAALYAAAVADVKRQVLGDGPASSTSSGPGRGRGKRGRPPARPMEAAPMDVESEGGRSSRRARRGAASTTATPTSSSDSRQQRPGGSDSRGASVNPAEVMEGSAPDQQQQQREGSVEGGPAPTTASAASGGQDSTAGGGAEVETAAAPIVPAAPALPPAPETVAVAGQAVTKLGARKIGHLFSHLRKLAQHPLLVRARFSDQDVAGMAQTAVAHQLFGGNCTLGRVTAELEGYSDYELHCFASAHSAFLGRWVLPPDALSDSGKLVALGRLLEDCRAGGHRPLIFSQWTSVLDIMEPWLRQQGYTYTRLDGSTPVVERQARVDAFNAPDSELFAFLLSTRAGGQGLNLTGADTVIMHDLDFNPQVDAQAEDRCHRLGQTRPVTVHRLVLTNTVDANIAAIAARKLDLDAAVLGGVTLGAHGAKEEGGGGGRRGGRGGRGGRAGSAAETAHMGEILAALLAA